MVTSSPSLMSTWALTLHYRMSQDVSPAHYLMSPGYAPGGDEEPAVADATVREEGEDGQQPAPGPGSHVGLAGMRKIFPCIQKRSVSFQCKKRFLSPSKSPWRR